MSEEKDILGGEKRRPGRPPAQKIAIEESTDYNTQGTGDLQPLYNSEEFVTISKSELAELKGILEFVKTNQIGVKTPSQEAVSTVDLISQFTQALKDVRKPYKSEADLENERRQREQSRIQEETKRLNIINGQANCSHMAGNYPGSRESNDSAIIWHEVHSHFWIGICTACNRQFWPNDPDYRFWRSKRSYNTASESGDRMVSAQAVEEWARKEHPEPFGRSAGFELVVEKPSFARRA
jgi:hypothetical protein